MSEIVTKVRFGTVRHAACDLTDDEHRVLCRNAAGVAAHVARRLQPGWPVEVVPVDLPIYINIFAGTAEVPEVYDLVTRAADAVAVAGPYRDALREDFQPELFAECFLEDAPRAVELYVARRRRPGVEEGE